MPSQWCKEYNLTHFTIDKMELSGMHSCCDQHHSCWKMDFIAQGEQKHGITNTMERPVTPCEYNSRFVKCLKAMHTLPAQVFYSLCTMYAFKDGIAKHQFFDQHYTQCDDDLR